MSDNHSQIMASRSWRIIYLLGGTAAVLAVVVFRRNFAAELHLTNGFGIFNVPAILPTGAAGWFALFAEEPFVALAFFGLIDLINFFLVGLMFLALYGALRHVHPGAMLLALILTFTGIAIFYATNQALPMMNLSNRYAAVTDAAARAALAAAGEALLAQFNPGAIYQGLGYYASLLFVLTAGLIISLVMWSSELFGKPAAVAGILANVLGLVYFAALAWAPAIVWLPPTLSAPLRIVWYIFIAIKLFGLSR